MEDHNQIFVANGSRVYDVDDEVIARLEAAVTIGDDAVEGVLDSCGLLLPRLINDLPLTSPPLRAISLAIAQKCNLGCTYCYASQGDFGGPPKDMTSQTAERAVRLLIDAAQPGDRVNVAFLGGEPMTNRTVLRATTEFAAAMAAAREVRIGFSITSNGTLLTADDADFFEQHGFAVTISLDGVREDHDRQRPFKNGNGSFDRIIDRVRPLLARQRKMQVSVRTTILPGNVLLRHSLEFFLDLGFHSVGFSPVLRSPNGHGELSATDLESFLDGMIECGLEFERRVLRGERYAFANIINALREIHRGTHRPYPCGAGAGYLGVSADGELAACHRFVGDSEGRMGDLSQGIDRESQNVWLAERHVHSQSPCGECWARYLCAGGCHHEVIARGRPACDFIRGWLRYSLQAYDRLSRLRPEWFMELPADRASTAIPRQ
ncbi:MAG TPA: radical SAM protein [Gemmatimonadaceae bacterium]|nr:radical SAM protein [Gemmatimonadaceae bacterium]